MTPLPLFPFILALFLWGCGQPNSDDAWITLFNGTNLDGWTVKSLPADAEKTFWRVEDGDLVVNSMGRPEHDYVWLVSEAEYGDFELQLQFKAMPGSIGNSGMQVRSRYDDQSDAPRGGWMDGPQVDIHAPLPWRTGLIYDETRSERRWIAPSLPDWNIDPSYAPDGWTNHEGDWNTLRIICKGTRIQTFLNDVPMADYNGSGLLDDEAHQQFRVGMNGHLALQLHSDDETHLRFRNLRIQAR